MLARRLTAILPAIPLADALDTTRMHRVAGLADGRAALVTGRLCRAPHHTISDLGRLGGGQCRGRATCRWPTTACAAWMDGPSSAAMCWRCCGNRGSHAPSYLMIRLTCTKLAKP
jgi:Magnesium chelatase, subunit ChlI